MDENERQEFNVLLKSAFSGSQTVVTSVSKWIVERHEKISAIVSDWFTFFMSTTEPKTQLTLIYIVNDAMQVGMKTHGKAFIVPFEAFLIEAIDYAFRSGDSYSRAHLVKTIEIWKKRSVLSKPMLTKLNTAIIHSRKKTTGSSSITTPRVLKFAGISTSIPLTSTPKETPEFLKGMEVPRDSVHLTGLEEKMNQVTKAETHFQLQLERIVKLKLALEIFQQAQIDYNDDDMNQEEEEEEKEDEEVIKVKNNIENAVIEEGSDGKIIWENFDSYTFVLETKAAEESIQSYRESIEQIGKKQQDLIQMLESFSTFDEYSTSNEKHSDVKEKLETYRGLVQIIQQAQRIKTKQEREEAKRIEELEKRRPMHHRRRTMNHHYESPRPQQQYHQQQQNKRQRHSYGGDNNKYGPSTMSRYGNRWS